MGVPRARIVGHNVAEFVPDEAKDARASEYEKAVAQGGGFGPPDALRRPDGSVVQVEVSRTVVDVGGSGTSSPSGAT